MTEYKRNIEHVLLNRVLEHRLKHLQVDHGLLRGFQLYLLSAFEPIFANAAKLAMTDGEIDELAAIVTSTLAATVAGTKETRDHFAKGAAE